MIASVTVVVPAKDEQDGIGACLESLLAASRRLTAERPMVRVSVVLVLDDCRDATAEIAARFVEVEVRTVQAASVGAARRAGAASVPPRADHWIANTDADCEVPEDWLTLMLGHADRGADIVLGTVRPSGLRAAVRDVWLARYDVGDGHRHVHGANLGIRADAYVAAGCWAELNAHEDVDLVARAERAGLVIHRCGDVVVHTSGRTEGRALHGFASYLRELGEEVTGGLSEAPAG